jgi:hypothetical protein
VSKNCKYLQEQHAIESESKILASGDLGTFYRYVNSKLSSKSGIAPLCAGENKYLSDAKSQADYFNKYFGSVCIADDGNVPACKRSVPPDLSLTDVKFTCTNTCKVMLKLKPCSGA